MIAKPPLNIGIAGLGTVGGGVVQILQQHAELLAKRAGRPLCITAVSARNRSSERGFSLPDVVWYDDATAMAHDANVDVVVELIGGAEGVAKNLVEAALQAGKSVVSANKALIAHHGLALAKLAEQHDAALLFEAAVAGGVPVIKTLREGLCANRFTGISGILNGTCNYILTTMEREGRNFDDVLAEAQALGYAEADPTFDVDGIDTAHKLAIIAALAYGVAPAIDHVVCEGIRHITPLDIAEANALGMTIRLLGIAMDTPEGVVQRVHPAIVTRGVGMGSVDDAFNAVQFEGDYVDKIFIEGRGAGAGPTASSVVADIMDLARDNDLPPLLCHSSALAEARIAPPELFSCCSYVRLEVADHPGVLADITAQVAACNVSVATLVQRPTNTGAQLIFTTHEATEAQMQALIIRLESLPSVQRPPVRIRMVR